MLISSWLPLPAVDVIVRQIVFLNHCEIKCAFLSTFRSPWPSRASIRTSIVSLSFEDAAQIFIQSAEILMTLRKIFNAAYIDFGIQ